MTKEELIKKLKKLEMTLKDFSNISDIPYSTINNWGSKSNDKMIPVPKWVKPFLEYYKKSEKYDFLINEMIGVVKELEKK